jgi:tetrahydromethanopterin:alpha-L-glutamate ligase
VDIIRDADGKLWVLEVNSIPAWRGLKNATLVDVAQILVDDLLSKG